MAALLCSKERSDWHQSAAWGLPNGTKAQRGGCRTAAVSEANVNSNIALPGESNVSIRSWFGTAHNCLACLSASKHLCHLIRALPRRRDAVTLLQGQNDVARAPGASISAPHFRDATNSSPVPIVLTNGRRGHSEWKPGRCRHMPTSRHVQGQPHRTVSVNPGNTSRDMPEDKSVA